jgi:catalase
MAANLSRMFTGHLLNGVTEPVLERAFWYWRNVNQTLGERVEKGIRAGQA